MNVFAVELQSLAPSQDIDTFGTLISAIVKNGFVLAGVISFILLILSGFGFIVAAGDTKKLESSRGRIIGSVLGLIIVVASFWIVQILEKVTGLKLLNPGL